MALRALRLAENLGYIRTQVDILEPLSSSAEALNYPLFKNLIGNETHQTDQAALFGSDRLVNTVGRMAGLSRSYVLQSSTPVAAVQIRLRPAHLLFV